LLTKDQQAALILDDEARQLLDLSWQVVEQAQREKEAAQKRRNRLILGAGITAIVVACLMTGLAVLAVRFALVSEARALAAQARSLLDDNPPQAVLLALAAQEIAQTDEAAAVIAEAPYLYPPLVSTLVGHTGVIWSPDGSRLASGSKDDTVRIWDVTSG